MKRVLLNIATVVLLWIPGVAHAHSGQEIEDWEDDWSQRWEEVTESDGGGVDPQDIRDLVAEKLDWVKRHWSHYYPDPDPEPVQRSVSTSRTETVAGEGVSRGMGSSVEQWRPLVQSYFGSETDTALCVMAGESGGNPNAKNPNSSARGLFQILGSTWAPYFGVSLEALYDPETNTRLAREILSIQGWGAWNAYWRC